MSRLDQFFKPRDEQPAQQSEPETLPAQSASAQGATDPAIAEGPIPPKQLNIANGKGEYQAFSAPKYERREWFFVVPRSGGQMGASEMLRYDNLYRIVYSEDGSVFMLVYVDQVYVIRGQKLTDAITNIADRYLDMLQEFDRTLHRPLMGDEPIITSIEAFQRRDPNIPELGRQADREAPTG